jgi:hypothetical protein
LQACLWQPEDEYLKALGQEGFLAGRQAGKDLAALRDHDAISIELDKQTA